MNIKQIKSSIEEAFCYGLITALILVAIFMLYIMFGGVRGLVIAVVVTLLVTLSIIILGYTWLYINKVLKIIKNIVKK